MYKSSFETPKSPLLRKRMIQGGLLSDNTVTHQFLKQNFPTNGPNTSLDPKRIKDIRAQRKITVIENRSAEKEDIMDISNVFLPKKRHFRETEEWRIKKKRVLTKMRALTKINLLLVLSKMSISINRIMTKISNCRMEESVSRCGL
ncbi:hypothetical protein RB195_015022 [Necator americanus]|uniref:Uncharacterized protein n=1 Tax=Necator americanus TaxID=51031 RepID=A0ABR1E4F3_NECAM